MSFLEIAALMRRHFIAVMAVFILAAGVLYDFKSTPQTYQESATVVFTPPTSLQNPNPYSSFGGSLITAGEIMIRFLMSPQGQQRVRAAGGTADFNVALVNLYNQEYPDFGDPYAILSASSDNPAAAHATFVVVARQLLGILAAKQAQAGVSPHNRVAARVVGDSGPVVQHGSSKRAYAGVLLLTIVPAFMVAISLDRRRDRRRGARRARPPAHSGPPARARPAEPARPGAR